MSVVYPERDRSDSRRNRPYRATRRSHSRSSSNSFYDLSSEIESRESSNDSDSFIHRQHRRPNSVPSLYRLKARQSKFRPRSGRGTFYRPTAFEDGEDLTFDISLKDLPDATTFRKHVQPQRNSTQNIVDAYLVESRPKGCHSIERKNVAECTYRTEANWSQTIIQIASVQDERSFRWLHMHWETPSVAELITFVSSLSGLHDDEPALAEKLLRRFEKSYTNSFASGYDFVPKTLRVHGRDTENPENMDECVTFCSFPYMAMLDPLSSSASTGTEIRHRTRSLLQFKYEQESTFERDLEQTIRDLEHVGGRKFLHVPQVWSLFLSSGTIITIAPQKLDAILPPWFQIDEPVPDMNASGSSTLVRFKDLYGKSLSFPMEHCRTWFGLLDKVMLACSSVAMEIGFEAEMQDFEILDGDGVKVTSGRWRTMVRACRTRYLDLAIRLLQAVAPPLPEVDIRIVRDEREDSTDSDSTDRGTRHSRSRSRSRTRTRTSTTYSTKSSGGSTRQDTSGTVKSQGRSGTVSPSRPATDVVDFVFEPDKFRESPMSTSPVRGNEQTILTETDKPQFPTSASPLRESEQTSVSQTARPDESSTSATLPTEDKQVSITEDEDVNKEEVAKPAPTEGPRKTNSGESAKLDANDGRDPEKTSRGGREDSFRRSLDDDDSDHPDMSKALVLRKRSTYAGNKASKHKDVHWNTPEAEQSDNVLDVRSPSRKRGALILRERSRERSRPRSTAYHSRPPSPPPLPPNRLERLPRKLPSPKILNDSPSDRGDHSLYYLQLAKVEKPRTSSSNTTPTRADKTLSIEPKEQTGLANVQQENDFLEPPSIIIPPIFTWDAIPSPNPNQRFIEGANGEADSTPDQKVLESITDHLFSSITDPRREDFSTIEEVKRYCDEFLDDVHESDRQRFPCNYTLMMADMHNLLDALEDIYCFFIPSAYEGEFSKFFWGRANDFLKRIKKLLVYQTKSQQTGLEYEQEYIVIGDGTDRYAIPGTGTSLPNQADARCTKKHHYFWNKNEALKHLRERHLSAEMVELGTRTSLEPFIIGGHDIWRVEARRKGQEIMQKVFDCFTEVQKLKREISDGVCDIDVFEREIYKKIPSHFVNAFGYLCNVCHYGAELAYETHKDAEAFENDADFLTFLSRDAMGWSRADKLQTAINDFEINMTSGEYGLMSMNNAAHEKENISYEAIGPETLLLQLIGGLIASPQTVLSGGHPSLKLLEAYLKHSSKMELQINHRPRQGLVRKINFFTEEASIIRSVYEVQENVLRDFHSLLDPATYHVTSESRRSLFVLEEEMAENLLDFVKDQQKAFRGLEAFGPRLSNLTRHAIEIQQEDHGKAILVFTLVTIVFLPLSFVTSLLGMNTKDIRTLNNTQSLFWAISIPLTFVTMLVALVIGYKGDAIRERMHNFVRQPVSGPPIAKRHDQMAPKRKVNFAEYSSDVEALPSSDEKATSSPSYAIRTKETDKYMPVRFKQRKADKEFITITERIYSERGRSRSPPPYDEFDRFSDRSSSRGSLSSFPRSRSGYRAADPAGYTDISSRALTKYRTRSRERIRRSPLVRRDSRLTGRSLSKGTRDGSHFYYEDDRSDTDPTGRELVPYRRRGDRSSSPARRRSYYNRETSSRKSTLDSPRRRSPDDRSARRSPSLSRAVDERSPPRRQPRTVSPPPPRHRTERIPRDREEVIIRRRERSPDIVIRREGSPPPRRSARSLSPSASRSPPPPISSSPPVERTRVREEIIIRSAARSPQRRHVRAPSPSAPAPRRRYETRTASPEREEIIIRRREDDVEDFERRRNPPNPLYDPSLYTAATPTRRRSTYYDDDDDDDDDIDYRSRRRRSTYDEDDYSYHPRERPRRRRSTRHDDYDDDDYYRPAQRPRRRRSTRDYDEYPRSRERASGGISRSGTTIIRAPERERSRAEARRRREHARHLRR